ncbi:ABC transporter substrate-binding protein [Thermatribacter velox]|jgi:multiple sugar transport system substrate-binding protein|uniref:ABC transporter substrate-binding protein n=1 Tax=Thermatribacter velox TaxID=3039681 RepID=A0ABZ2YDU8_9BACT|nr:trehalose/maltose transport system substrate-binding protein [Candidatus Atribacteria bacterium]
MEKMVVVLLVSLLILLSFVANALAGDAVKVVLGISPREVGNVLPDLLEEFERENPQINVEWMKVPGVPGEQHSLYVTNLLGGSPTPDVIAIDMIWGGEFAANGWARPLNDFFSEKAREDFIDVALDPVLLNGKVYGVPLYINGIHFFYRKDLLDKYGLEVPATWEDVVESSKKVLAGEKDENLVGLVSMWARIEGLFMNYLQFFWGAGGEFFDPSGKVLVNGPEGLKALQFMVDLLYKHKMVPESVLTYKPDDARVLFQQGRSIFMVVQSYVWPMLNASDSNVAGKVDFQRVPYFEGHPETRTICLGGWNLVINPYSKHPEEAWKLVSFLTNLESQLKLTLHTGNLSARKSVFEQPEVLSEGKTALKMFEQYMKAGNVRPSSLSGSKYPQLSDIMQSSIHSALLLEKQPQEALEDAAKKIEELMSE